LTATDGDHKSTIVTIRRRSWFGYSPELGLTEEEHLRLAAAASRFQEFERQIARGTPTPRGRMLAWSKTGPENIRIDLAHKLLIFRNFAIWFLWSHNHLFSGLLPDITLAAKEAVMQPKRAALYLRVSTDGQSVDNQRLALEAVCEQRAWRVTQVYSDNGVSGAKSRSQRPGLDALLKDASRGRFNVVLAWALDRLGRSLVDLLDTLAELDAAGVALVLHQQAIDTTTPAGRMFFQVTGAFAEFERGMIRSRVVAGLERARARGVRLGRPRISAKVEAAIRTRLAGGEGIKKVAKAVGVGNGTVSRVKAGMAG
jgi:DNA invertase Pin-like site-specific DNA recombinase